MIRKDGAGGAPVEESFPDAFIWLDILASGVRAGALERPREGIQEVQVSH